MESEKQQAPQSEPQRQPQPHPQEQPQNQQQHQSQEPQSPLVEADIVRTQSFETPVSDFSIPPEDPVLAWSSNIFSDSTLGGMLSMDGLGDLPLDGQTDAPPSESSYELVNKSTASPDFSFDLSNADLSINQFVVPDIMNQNTASAGPCFSESSSPINQLACPQVPALTTSLKASQHEPYADQSGQQRKYPHVLALTKIIELLEAHIQLQATPIDELMRVNKASMIDITRIMEMKEYAVCKSCGILVSTAMELVVTLYEMGVSSENNPSQKQQSQQSALCGNELPNLQFGVFEVDPEEQIACRNRIICKELQRSIDIIRRFSQQNQSTAIEGSHSGKVHKQWYVEMEHRAKRLVSSLGGWLN